MLVSTSKDRFAHIRKPGTDMTWCGQSVYLFGSTKNCELCDHCLDAVEKAEKESHRGSRAACLVE